MSKKRFLTSAVLSAVGTAGAALAVKRKINEKMSDENGKKEMLDLADRAVMSVVGKLANGVSDKCIPFLNRYDNSGFMEGSGYFLEQPAKGAKWRLGFAKGVVIPEEYSGDVYLGGYLAFPPNRANGKLTDQLIRAIAVDDDSGRGINVFAVIDCIGLVNSDVRKIRGMLSELINEKNIVSINISATHCHSGADTMGLWGDLVKALRTNVKAVKSQKTAQNVSSGRNSEVMDFLFETARQVITEAVNNMRPGQLSFALKDASDLVSGKRPPYKPDDVMTVLRFKPNNGGKELRAVFLAAHPTCYGERQRELSADFPYFICSELEENGFDAMFFQGDQAAVATSRGKFTPEGASTHQSIEAYGRGIARCVIDTPEDEFIKIKPLINVRLKEVFIPADNPILTLAGKLKLVNNTVAKITMDDSGDKYDLCFPTEVGYVELGSDLKLALIPGEMCPEINVGGTLEADESYTGKAWEYPPLKDITQGRLTVIGLCNDEIGYIVPNNDFGSIFAPLHYEEAVSAGRRTASNIVACFIRAVEDGEKSRLTKDILSLGDKN